VEGKVKVHILFYGDNSWTVARSQMKFLYSKMVDILADFIPIVTLFVEASKYGDGEKF
jgi:hypothetical protein